MARDSLLASARPGGTVGPSPGGLPRQPAWPDGFTRRHNYGIVEPPRRTHKRQVLHKKHQWYAFLSLRFFRADAVVIATLLAEFGDWPWNGVSIFVRRGSSWFLRGTYTFTFHHVANGPCVFTDLNEVSVRDWLREKIPAEPRNISTSPAASTGWMKTTSSSSLAALGKTLNYFAFSLCIAMHGIKHA